MDGRPTLAGTMRASAGEALDQAIFTSLRSPTARGYRLVATSPGLCEDEKRELVQRAPSHGNLTSDTDDATALAGWVLRSGRHALLFSQHAGPETSGRGGRRVHTHAFLLSPRLYRRFSCDPFRVQALGRAHVAAGLLKLASSSLPAIPLAEAPPSKRPANSPGPRSIAELDSIAAVVENVLRNCPMLVTGVPSPLGALSAVLAATPLAVRQSLSFSLGMKPSAQRDFQLILDESAGRAASTVTRDPAYTPIAWGTPRAASDGPYGPWLAFARRHWERGELDTLFTLTDEMDDGHVPEMLARVADWATTRAEVVGWDANRLEEVQARWPAAEPATRVERRLLGELRLVVAERLAALGSNPPQSDASSDVGSTSSSGIER